ncbi:acid-sensing ion channel 3 [Eurytemora carolleeae]|uniref:acid-sensing ion channel 3 n=1 Tax=Eurytemora carolleeae TaxID=1294199 RepID=UPI000C774F1F|nr:acid-sensing ion channel 3 [Eurytemora carolleeae]|eukprot:XP_023319624.1 acid-sensing ion channel 3-like [Eurytemora affinis]
MKVSPDVSTSLNSSIAPFSALASRGAAVALTGQRQRIFHAVSKSLNWMMPNTVNFLKIFREIVDVTDMKNSMFHRSNCLALNEVEKLPEEQTRLSLTPGLARYSLSGCEEYLLQKVSLSLANCSMLYFPDVPGTRICDPVETSQFIVYMENLEEFGLERVLSISDQECIKVCRSTTYQAKISSAQISNRIQSLFNLFSSKNEIHADGIFVTVYYSTFDYKEIAYKGKSLNDWLSAVGGNIGLYIGASIFTILEPIILIEQAFTELICSLVSKLIKK